MSHSTQWAVSGHNRSVRLLAQDSESPAHAYLFVGPAGVGKRTVALEFARALNCESEPTPCHHCVSCRLIAHGGHPDVTLIEPEEKERISIEQIRALRSDLALLPSQSPWRVVLIRAGMLTESAADALLKTLEEPNPRVVLLLTANDLTAIPQTVVSRCRVVNFGLVATSEITIHLQNSGTAADEAAKIAAMAQGAIGWAVRAASDAELVAEQERIRARLNRWSASSLLTKMAAAEELASSSRQPDKTRQAVLAELQLLMAARRDTLLRAVMAHDNANGTDSRLTAEESPSVRRAVQAIRTIAKAAERIDQNVDPRLTLEAMAFDL